MSNPRITYQGRLALITGGSAGIGLALAQAAGRSRRKRLAVGAAYRDA